MKTEALQIHRTPGRLRVRSPHLKQNPAGAMQLRVKLLEHSGVKSVHLSSPTGSLLVHFDPSGSTPDKLLELMLTSEHAFPSRITPPTHVITRRHYDHAGRKIARVACAYAGEKLMEYLVVTLISVVL